MAGSSLVVKGGFSGVLGCAVALGGWASTSSLAAKMCSDFKGTSGWDSQGGMNGTRKDPGFIPSEPLIFREEGRGTAGVRVALRQQF